GSSSATVCSRAATDGRRSRPSRRRPDLPGRRCAMPELQEVETIRRDLEREVVGRKIKSTEVHGLRSIRRHGTKKAFTSRLDDRKIDRVRRLGKNLVLSLGDDELVVHLGMSGQLLKAAVKDPVVKHTHVVITFTQGGQL